LGVAGWVKPALPPNPTENAIDREIKAREDFLNIIIEGPCGEFRS
jgi:hypothetical protein